MWGTEQSRCHADKGSWVRVRTQQYKGDLAKVVEIDLARGQAEVKLVPRLDYAAMAKARAEGGAANRFGRQAPGAVRPAARSALSMASPRRVTWVRPVRAVRC